MINPNAKLWKCKIDYSGKGYLAFNYNNVQVSFPYFLRALSTVLLSLSRGARSSNKTSQTTHSCINLPSTLENEGNVNKIENLKKYKNLSESNSQKYIKSQYYNSRKRNLDVSDDQKSQEHYS